MVNGIWYTRYREVREVRVNKAESKAFQWLRENGYANIVFRRRATPDFLTSAGRFEVKRLYGHKVVFREMQMRAMQPADVVLVFDDEHVVPVATFRWSERMGLDARIQVHVATEVKVVQVAEESYRRLTVLKLAWRLPSYDEVIMALTEPHRGEELKALNVQVRLD